MGRVSIERDQLSWLSELTRVHDALQSSASCAMVGYRERRPGLPRLGDATCSSQERSYEVAGKGKSFSIIRLNIDDTGWGVVDDASGALVHIDGLALKLTKERAKDVAATLNAEAQERGSAGDES